MRKPAFSSLQTKTQIYRAVTAQLISAFFFATQFQVFFDCTCRFVLDLVRNPEDQFSCVTANLTLSEFSGHLIDILYLTDHPGS